MRIVAKVDGGCTSLATAPQHAFVYVADGNGTIHVLCHEGEQSLTKVKNADGLEDLVLMRGGTRLAFASGRRTVLAWREIRQNGRLGPASIKALPLTESPALCSAVCPYGRVIGVGHVGGNVGLYAFGSMGRLTNKLQYRTHFAIHHRPDVHCLGMVGATRTFAVAGYEDRAAVMMLMGDSPPAHVGDVSPGHKILQVAGTKNDAIYAILENGRLMKAGIVEEEAGDASGFPQLTAPEVVRVPGEPRLLAIAVSPCGGYVAVGADFHDEYGAVLLYDATDLRPLAMFDCQSEPQTLAFAEFSSTEILPDPYLPVERTELALFSGHYNGHVIKWYVSRQLQWLRRIAERPARAPGPTGPDYDAGASERALDL